MGIFDEDFDESLSGKNHKSPGTRFGLKFDPMAYFLDLFGKGDDYRDFINKTGDTANKAVSKVAKPLHKFTTQIDPIAKAVDDSKEGGKVNEWVTNKPASAVGIVTGAMAGGSALSGLGGGASSGVGEGVTGWGGASTGGLEGASSFAPGMSVGGGNAGALAASHGIGGGAGMGAAQGASAAPAATGFDWQGMLKQGGQSLQQQGQKEDEMLTKLAMMGPPPNMQGGGPMQPTDAPQQYAELLKRAPVNGQTRGEANTTAGLGI